MSRIGNKLINLPEGVTVSQNGNVITVTRPNGELSNTIDSNIQVVVEGQTVTVKRPNDTKAMKTIHGTTRANIHNMVEGVSKGFTKTLEIVGVGYRASLKGNTLVVSAGYSHDVELEIPAGIKVELPKNTQVVVSGSDKQVVGQFAANVRGVREPEPYLGKGIHYSDEHIRRKEGKTAKK